MLAGHKGDLNCCRLANTTLGRELNSLSCVQLSLCFFKLFLELHVLLFILSFPLLLLVQSRANKTNKLGNLFTALVCHLPQPAFVPSIGSVLLAQNSFWCIGADWLEEFLRIFHGTHYFFQTKTVFILGCVKREGLQVEWFPLHELPALHQKGFLGLCFLNRD